MKYCIWCGNTHKNDGLVCADCENDLDNGKSPDRDYYGEGWDNPDVDYLNDDYQDDEIDDFWEAHHN